MATRGEGYLFEGILGQMAAQPTAPFQLYSAGRAYAPLFRPLFAMLGMIVVTDGKVFLYRYQG